MRGFLLDTNCISEAVRFHPRTLSTGLDRSHRRRLALPERSYTQRDSGGPCTPSLQEADEARDVAGGRIASPSFRKSFIN
jgi:hypothetical protein